MAAAHSLPFDRLDFRLAYARMGARLGAHLDVANDTPSPEDFTRALKRALRDGGPAERELAEVLHDSVSWDRDENGWSPPLMWWANALARQLPPTEPSNDNGKPKPKAGRGAEDDFRGTTLVGLGSVIEILSRDWHPEPHGDPLQLVSEQRRLDGATQLELRFDIEGDRLLAGRGAAWLGSALAVRLYLFLGNRCLDQRAEGRVHWETMDFDSWRNLADELGANGREREQLPAVVHAMECLRVDLPQPLGTDRIFSLLAGPALLRFRACEGLMTACIYDDRVKDYTRRHKRNNPSARFNRWLVPWPMYEAPLVGRRNDHAAQLRLSLAVTAHLRRSGEEIASGDGALIDEREWHRMAEHCGVPQSIVPRIVERWCREATPEERARGDYAPAFLRRIGPDRFVHAHARTHELILDGGRLSVRGEKQNEKKQKRRRQPWRERRRRP